MDERMTYDLSDTPPDVGQRCEVLHPTSGRWLFARWTGKHFEQKEPAGIRRLNPDTRIWRPPHSPDDTNE